MTLPPRCTRVGGRHDFERVVVKEEREATGKVKGSMWPDELRKLMYYTVEHYHGHVCRICGLTVNVPEKS